MSRDFLTAWDEFYREVDDVAVTLGLYPISGDTQHVSLGMPLRPQIGQPQGWFSAPALFGAADVAGTWLAMLNCDDGAFPLAVQSSVNLLNNGDFPEVVARAELVRAGRTLVVTTTRVSAGEVLLATATTTYIVPRT